MRSAFSASSCLPSLKCFPKVEQKLLKVFLLCRLRQLLSHLFQKLIQSDVNHNAHSAMECYHMDSKVIQFLIRDIVETGEYTLEGISYHTRIPFDVILDAVCGNSPQLSITPWAKIVDLYMQVKPEISKLLLKQLLETTGGGKA